MSLAFNVGLHLLQLFRELSLLCLILLDLRLQKLIFFGILNAHLNELFKVFKAVSPLHLIDVGIGQMVRVELSL